MGQSEKMEQEDNRPKWLMELENRKRKPRLAHEVGAGAPCMTCSAACPGLDLHFWRKICKNCKCSRDDHDVPNDEFPQFDLLFGPTGKPNRKMIVLTVKKKQTEDEVTFEWAPPNTTKELAADYMKALPEDKLPIKGSSGAALRKQQLQRQLPLHDIDHKVCDELSDSERKQFEKYLENLKKYVGQGKVMKAIGARPFDRSLMTTANATDMNRFSPQHKQPDIVLNLRTPSSFVKKSTFRTSGELTNGPRSRNTDSPIHDRNVARTEIVRSPYFDNVQRENSPRGRYHRALANVRYDSEIMTSEPVGGARNSPLNFARTSGINDPAYSLEKKTIENRADNSSGLRKTINSLGENSEFAASSMLVDESSGNFTGLRENVGKDKINDNQNNAITSIFDREIASAVNSKLMPPAGSYGYPAEEMTSEARAQEDALRMLNEALLPPSSINTPDIIGSTLDEKGLSFIREKLTSKYSAKEPTQLGPIGSRALPFNAKRDDPARSKRADKLRRQAAFEIETDRNEILAAMKNPSGITSRESDYLNDSTLTVKNLQAHIAESPVNTNSENAFRKNCEGESWGQIMRGICDNNIGKTGHAKMIPRDNRNFDTCGDLTNSSHVDPVTSLRAEMCNYGPGNSNIVRSEKLNNPAFPEHAKFSTGIAQNPVSVDSLRGAIDELSQTAHDCHQCHEPIRAGDVVVTAEKANDAFWHPGCFVCSVCNQLLADLVYFYNKGKLYCGRDLATLLEIPRCFACDELIFVREYTVAEGHNYHVKHFCCWDCDLPLAGLQYISENDRPLCLPCYQKTYAKTCRTCDGLITAHQQGVGVKNLNFHANDECFCCATCKKSLLNGKMAIKEDRPFCSKECITQFLNEREN